MIILFTDIKPLHKVKNCKNKKVEKVSYVITQLNMILTPSTDPNQTYFENLRIYCWHSLQILCKEPKKEEKEEEHVNKKKTKTSLWKLNAINACSPALTRVAKEKRPGLWAPIRYLKYGCF